MARVRATSRLLIALVATGFFIAPAQAHTGDGHTSDVDISVVRCGPWGSPPLQILGTTTFTTAADLELQCGPVSRTYFGRVVSGVGKVRVDAERYGSKNGKAHIHVDHRKHDIPSGSTRIPGLSHREQKKLDKIPGFRKAVGNAVTYATGNAGAWKVFLR